MMTLSVNGEQRAAPEGQTLRAALTEWGYRDKKVAVARNGEFVPRSAYETMVLRDGDCIDVVAPMEGG